MNKLNYTKLTVLIFLFLGVTACGKDDALPADAGELVDVNVNFITRAGDVTETWEEGTCIRLYWTNFGENTPKEKVWQLLDQNQTWRVEGDELLAILPATFEAYTPGDIERSQTNAKWFSFWMMKHSDGKDASIQNNTSAGRFMYEADWRTTDAPITISDPEQARFELVLKHRLCKVKVTLKNYGAGFDAMPPISDFRFRTAQTVVCNDDGSFTAEPGTQTIDVIPLEGAENNCKTYTAILAPAAADTHFLTLTTKDGLVLKAYLPKALASGCSYSFDLTVQKSEITATATDAIQGWGNENDEIEIK